MTLKELISFYDNKALPSPAYATLCALRRLAEVERCPYVVRYKGVTVAAFHDHRHAEAFAAKGRLDTPSGSPIEVVAI